MVGPLYQGAIFAVTGAGSGIGRAIAEALVGKGARCVVAIDRNEEAALDTARHIGPAAVGIGLDVSDGHAVAGLVASIEQEHGPITGWFSNAGVSRGEGLGSDAEWRVSLDVNLLAHVQAARTLLPLMEARGRGCFVITASAAGLLTDLRSATYSASKHAAVGLAEWLAISVGEGVSIHCVCPEGVTTRMTRPDSHRAAAGIGFIAPEAVADATLDGVERGEFLIFTHPRTSEFERRRVHDRPRWLAGMRRARQAMFGAAQGNPPSEGA